MWVSKLCHIHHHAMHKVRIYSRNIAGLHGRLHIVLRADGLAFYDAPRSCRGTIALSCILGYVFIIDSHTLYRVYTAHTLRGWILLLTLLHTL